MRKEEPSMGMFVVLEHIRLVKSPDCLADLKLCATSDPIFERHIPTSKHKISTTRHKPPHKNRIFGPQ